MIKCKHFNRDFVTEECVCRFCGHDYRNERIKELEGERDRYMSLYDPIYEDRLPEDMSEELYDAWFQLSFIKHGIRMGPPLPPPPETEKT